MEIFKIQVSQMGIGEQFSVCEKHCLLFSLNSNCAVFEPLPHKNSKEKKKKEDQRNSNQTVGVFGIAVIFYQNAKYLNADGLHSLLF